RTCCSSPAPRSSSTSRRTPRRVISSSAPTTSRNWTTWWRRGRPSKKRTERAVTARQFELTLPRSVIRAKNVKDLDRHSASPDHYSSREGGVAQWPEPAGKDEENCTPESACCRSAAD